MPCALQGAGRTGVWPRNPPVVRRLVSNPSIVGLRDGRFAAGWEEDGAVWLTLVKPGKYGAPVKVSHAEAAQISLGYDPQGGLFAAWVERNGDHLQLQVGRLELTANQIRLAQSNPVDAQPPIEDQAYPALVVNADGSVVVVWEDRRYKHTVMLVANGPDGEHFGAPYRLIDKTRNLITGPAAKLGAGMGAMRPTLAGCGSGPIAGREMGWGSGRGRALRGGSLAGQAGFSVWL